MRNLRSRLLAAVGGEHLRNAATAKFRCDGVTAFNSLQKSGVTAPACVTHELSRKINAVTPSHSNSADREGALQNRTDQENLRQTYSRVLAALCERCPNLVDEYRWRRAAADAESFVARWGERAAALGWTAKDLFGLAVVPDRPASNYQRLSRYDQTGLIWLLQARSVLALTEKTAVIETATGTVSYRRYNKPALGPLGDNLDDMGTC